MQISIQMSIQGKRGFKEFENRFSKIDQQNYILMMKIF